MPGFGCDCCEPPTEFSVDRLNASCTVWEMLATDDGMGNWSVARTWSDHHCQDNATPYQHPVLGNLATVTRIRTDGTDVYSFGTGCGLREEVFDTAGADTFTWPVGVRTITVTVIGGGGSGGSGTPASGGGGGGALARSVITRSVASLTSARTDNLTVGGVAGDSWYIDSSTVLAKGGSSASTTTGGAGGSAASSIGDETFDGGAGADASGTTGGGGGGTPLFSGLGEVTAGTDASGATGGVRGGQDGGTDTNPGVDATVAGAGGSGSGDNNSTAGVGADGKIIINYFVRRPLTKWDGSGNFQWEVETQILNDDETLTTGGFFGTSPNYNPLTSTFEVYNGLAVATTPALGGHAQKLVAVTTSTGAISWIYDLDDIPDRFELGPQIVGSSQDASVGLAIAASGIYAATSRVSGVETIPGALFDPTPIPQYGYILRWDTSGTLEYEMAPGIPLNASDNDKRFSGGPIVVDSNCYIYTYQLLRIPSNEDNTIRGRIVKYAPIDTGIEEGPICGEINQVTTFPNHNYSALMVVAESGFFDCTVVVTDDGQTDAFYGYELSANLSLSPDESVLYFSVPAPTEIVGESVGLCNLYQLDPADLSVNWGVYGPGDEQDVLTDPVTTYRLSRFLDISARDDGVLCAIRTSASAIATDGYPFFFAASYDETGTLEYQYGLNSYVEGYNDVTVGNIFTVAADLTGVHYVGGTPSYCSSLGETEYSEGATCCTDQPTTLSGIPLSVSDTFPSYDCWIIPDDWTISASCLTCLQGLDGDAITWVRVFRPHWAGFLYKARVRVQCSGAAGDCGEDNWVDLYAWKPAGITCPTCPPDPNAYWRVRADFQCEGEVWPCIEARYVITHQGNDTHTHPWFEICCLTCETDNPLTRGVCAWQYRSGEWHLLQSWAGSGFTCFDDETAPAGAGTEGEIQCTCPCGNGCSATEVDPPPSDYVWSLNCPCETIPKVFTGYIFGTDCFDGEIFEIEYIWVSECTWKGVFAPNASCPDEVVTHYVTEQDDGTWLGRMEWSCAGGASNPKFATHQSTCNPVNIQGPDTPYFWAAEEINCICCNTDGGFDTDPGIPSDCCPSDNIPSLLLGTFDSSGTGGLCDNLDGVEILFVYDSGSDTWVYSGTLSCGDPADLVMNCNGLVCADLELAGDIKGATITNVVNDSCACDPFSVAFTFDMQVTPPETFDCCTSDIISGVKLTLVPY